MTTADAFRLATMALDAASIVASFVPGAGTGVAAGLGPQITKMMLALRAKGFDVNTAVYTVEDAKKEILGIIGGGKNA